MVSVKARIDKILKGQGLGGFDGCERDEHSSAYIVCDFFLSPADLEEFLPDLTPAQRDKPLGEIGNYRRTPFFPLSERDRISCGPFGCFEGIWFSYAAMLCVD